VMNGPKVETEAKRLYCALAIDSRNTATDSVNVNINIEMTFLI